MVGAKRDKHGGYDQVDGGAHDVESRALTLLVIVNRLGRGVETGVDPLAHGYGNDMSDALNHRLHEAHDGTGGTA